MGIFSRKSDDNTTSTVDTYSKAILSEIDFTSTVNNEDVIKKFKVTECIKDRFYLNRYGIVEINKDNVDDSDISRSIKFDSEITEYNTIISHSIFQAACELATLMIDTLVDEDTGEYDESLSDCKSDFKLNKIQIGDTAIYEVYVYFMDSDERFVYESEYIVFKID